jgi:hypothetical protein
MDRRSHDLGNLSADYHKAISGDGIYVKLAHKKTGESFRSLDFCGGASVACFGNGGDSASAEYNRVADATVAQIRQLAYVSHTTYRTDINFDLTELLVRNANRYLVRDGGGEQWRYQDIEADESSKMTHAIIVNSGKTTITIQSGSLVDVLEVLRRLRRLSRRSGNIGVSRGSRPREGYSLAKAHTMVILWGRYR